MFWRKDPEEAQVVSTPEVQLAIDGASWSSPSDGDNMHLPDNLNLTAEDILDLQKTGNDTGDMAAYDENFSGNEEEDEAMDRVPSRGQRKAEQPALRLKPATICMMNPQRGLELMKQFEARAKRKAQVASGFGYLLVAALCGVCSYIAIVYGQLLFERVGTGAAKGFLASWGMSILWDLGIMEWMAAFRKFFMRLAAASVVTVLIGAYTLSNWYEDYSDFTTIDMMAGDDVLDDLTQAMDDIETGD